MSRGHLAVHKVPLHIYCKGNLVQSEHRGQTEYYLCLGTSLENG